MAKAKRIAAHDSLVRNVFSRRKAVAILLRRVLHPELLVYVDFGSLRPDPTAHTDDGLGTRHTDLCFIVDLVYDGRRYPLHLVIEHQSTPAPRMPWRAHVYVGDLWRRYIKDHPGAPYTLPFVLPILLVQHPARNTPRRLTGILAMPSALQRLLGTPVELALVVDDFSGSVLDDHAADPATRALVELARAFLYAYKNPGSLTRARMAVLAAQLDILLEHNSPDDDSCGSDDVGALWKYVIEVFEEGSPLRELLIEGVSQPVREVYMTIKEALLAEGEKKGMAKGEKKGMAKGEKKGMAKGEKKGMAKGRAAAVIDVLELRAVPIPAPVRERVLATRDEPLLRRWLARAVTIASADALFEPLEV
jgi:Putative transposase, YhgA-like